MHVRVEEKEEDHAEGHQVHIDAEDHTAVVPVPSRLHAPDCVHGADSSDESGEEQERGGTVVWKAREEKSDNETAQDQQTASKQRMFTRIEKAWSQGAPRICSVKGFTGDPELLNAGNQRGWIQLPA